MADSYDSERLKLYIFFYTLFPVRHLNALQCGIGFSLMDGMVWVCLEGGVGTHNEGS